MDNCQLLNVHHPSEAENIKAGRGGTGTRNWREDLQFLEQGVWGLLAGDLLLVAFPVTFHRHPVTLDVFPLPHFQPGLHIDLHDSRYHVVPPGHTHTHTHPRPPTI